MQTIYLRSGDDIFIVAAIIIFLRIMSIKCGNLTSLLVSEHFGKVARKIHDELLWGPKPLKFIAGNTGFSLGVIKRTLGVLIKYEFVTFEPGKIPNVAEYRLNQDNILLLLRYPRYLNLVKEKYGELFRLLLEELLNSGILTGTNLILRVREKVKDKEDCSMLAVKNAFLDMVKYLYFTSCTKFSNDRVPVAKIEENTLASSSPDLNLKKLMALEMGKQEEHDDCNSYWKVNFQRLHQDMRDAIMIEGLRRRVDDNAGILLEELLKLVYMRTNPWAACSNPVPYLELRDALDKKGTWPVLVQYLEQYFKVIEEDSLTYIRRFGEGSSISLFVNFNTAFENIAGTVMDNLVEQRFGPKAARIFRLVKAKKFVDQEHVQKLAMIPDKEAKQLMYKLLQENFLQMMELRRSASGGINKCFFLFHIDWNQVARSMLETCYKAMFNCLTRCEHERREHSRLIEKNDKLLSIAECMREQGTDEQQIQELVDEWITPPEKQLLDTVTRMIDRLQLAQLYVDHTVFILSMYMFYQSKTNCEPKK